jgi:hypothetical protein
MTPQMRGGCKLALHACAAEHRGDCEYERRDLTIAPFGYQDCCSWFSYWRVAPRLGRYA